MLVLLWQNYGCSDIYELGNPEKEKELIKELIEVADQNQIAEGLSDTMPVGVIVCLINKQSDDVDAFEKLDIFSTK